MPGPFGRTFMSCLGRARCVLKPVIDDADSLQMQHVSILFRMVLFLKTINFSKKSFEHNSYFILNL
jgi:hypothetical protein